MNHVSGFRNEAHDRTSKYTVQANGLLLFDNLISISMDQLHRTCDILVEPISKLLTGVDPL